MDFFRDLGVNDLRLTSPIPSGHFRKPGCDCYANRTNTLISARKEKHYPLGRADSEEVVSACPPYDEAQLPEFYKKMQN